MENFLVSTFLKRIRSEQNITQEKMAEKLSMSARTYQRVEANESHLNVTQFLRLLKQVDDNLFLSFLSSLSSQAKSKDFSVINNREIFDAQTEHAFKQKSYLEENADSPLEFLSFDGEVVLGYWEWNLKTEEIFLSEEMYRIYNIDQSKPLTSKGFSTFINEGDLETIERGLNNLISKNIPYVNQHRVKHDKGSWTVNSTAFIIEQNNEPIVIASNKAFVTE